MLCSQAKINISLPTIRSPEGREHSTDLSSPGWRLRLGRCLVVTTMVRPLRVSRFANPENRVCFLFGYLSPAVPTAGYWVRMHRPARRTHPWQFHHPSPPAPPASRNDKFVPWRISPLTLNHGGIYPASFCPRGMCIGIARTASLPCDRHCDTCRCASSLRESSPAG